MTLSERFLIGLFLKLSLLSNTTFSGEVVKIDGERCCYVSLFHVKTAFTPATPEEFEDVALFLRLGLSSTLIRHENGDFRKQSSNRSNLKTQALRFRVERKHFENEDF